MTKKMIYAALGAAFTAGLVFGVKKNKEHEQNTEDIQMLKEYLMNHPFPDGGDEVVVDTDVDIDVK